MKQGRCIAALALLVALAACPPPIAHAAPRSAGASSTKSAAKSRVSMRQFTGVVTALDKTSLTVEKGGKAAKTMVFVRHDEMKTTGDLAKDARVTVYYREEGGRTVAHRVVVKGATLTASG